MKASKQSIQLASFDKLEEIMDLFRSCALSMNSKGLYNWSLDYPDLNTIATDIQNNELHIYNQKCVKGAITITSQQPDQYSNLCWSDDLSNSIVFRRLAVHPDYQRKGIAKKLIEFSENYAQSKGKSSIRIDVYRKSTEAMRFYLSMGYLNVEEFSFDNPDMKFVAMEKRLLV
jgi:GNAT superfamily N-acetyltransferase